MTEVMSIKKVKVRGRRSRSQRSKPKLEFTYGNEMMHKAWWGLGEVPYYFSRSSAKFQGHVNFDPNWAFSDCNSSLNSPMVMKWCTKLEVA